MKHYTHLTSEQRYYIYLSHANGNKVVDIARTIGVHRSTIYRELRRNGTENGKYVWCKAQEKADKRKHTTSRNRAKPVELMWRVRQMITENDWSPEQISGVLLKENIRISKQCIYNHIHKDTTGELAKHCRHGARRKVRHRTKHVTKATNIKNRTSIHNRPADADDKHFGNFEMDLIVDRKGHSILTIVERSTCYLLMAMVPDGKKSSSVARVAYRLLFPYRDKIYTLTTDNGSEFAQHEWLAQKLHLRQPIYFTDSFCSWQKGCVENTNKLIRQYIPKGVDISMLSPGFIDSVQKRLNARPRKKLKFNTPKALYFKYFI